MVVFGMQTEDLRLTIPEVAATTAISAAQIRRWIAARKKAKAGDGILILGAEGDKPSDGPGRDTLISWETTLQIAIAGRLVANGISVSDALRAGMEYAHIGDSQGGWADEETKLLRAPGKNFPVGETWLLVAGDISRVVNILENTEPNIGQYKSLQDAIRYFQADNRLRRNAPLGSEHEAVTTLHMDFLEELIRRRLLRTLETMRVKNTRLNR